MSKSIPRAECTHDALSFGSGDFYIFCTKCSARWSTTTWAQPEYGVDADGQKIGAVPEAANQGVGGQLSGHVRRNVDDLPRALDLIEQMSKFFIENPQWTRLSEEARVFAREARSKLDSKT